MGLPHERAFGYRTVAFWSVSVVAVAAGIAELAPSEMLLAVGGTAAVSVIGYFYALTLGRLDARRGKGHPRKLHATALVGFYAPILGAVGMVVARPWLLELHGKTPLERAAGLLVVPFLLSVAAGSLRAGHESGAIG